MEHSYHFTNAFFTSNNSINRAKQLMNILKDEVHINFLKSINHKYVFIKHSYHFTNAFFTSNNSINRAKQFMNILNDEARIKF